MSPDLRKKLEVCRWEPGRRVDDAQIAAWIRAATHTYGCHVFPEAVRVLREFGGLNLVIGSGAPLFVDPASGDEMFGDAEMWLLWEWRIKQVLFPIAFDSYLTVFAVSPDGAIYSSGIAGPHLEGESFEEMLENYSMNKKAIEMVEAYGENAEATEQEAIQIYRAITERKES